jgi:hypothetical protein
VKLLHIVGFSTKKKITLGGLIDLMTSKL